VKIKRIIFVLILLLLAFVLMRLPSAISAARQHREWDRTVQALRSLPRERVDTAVQAFLHGKAGTTAPPATVTFAELVSGGYLHTNDVAAFGGKQVVVFIGVDGSTPAGAYLLVHLTDTRDVVEEADGSIMMRPRL
jgi:hypothetical protein